ncbi:MAG: hypothetical protein Q7U77_12545, partial [Sediminibacterium sp.]|uniref:ISAon1 family transposase N-terminal region protein n=1 Tax=Sediminibacterium sp. TaxID=1917865 RepID=UPI002727CE65
DLRVNPDSLHCSTKANICSFLLISFLIQNYLSSTKGKTWRRWGGYVYLDERDIKPTGYSDKKLTSKGFHSESVIQDFPIRDKAVFLHVRRRRWLVEPDGEVVSKDWDSVAEGTRYTKSFADFLKGFLR